MLKKNKQSVLYFLFIICSSGLLIFNFVNYLQDFNLTFFQMITYNLLLLFFIWGISIILYIVFSQVKIEKYYKFLISSIFIGLLFILFYKPFNFPDERIHYVSAYEYSNRLLNTSIFGQDSNISMKVSDYNFFSSQDFKDKPLIYLLFQNKLFVNHQSQAILEHSIIESPIPYMFQILGLTLARILNFNPFYTYFLGKLFPLLFYTFVAFFFLKKINCKTNFFYLILLLPLTIQQLVSFSYDGFTNTISICFVLLILYLFQNYNKQVLVYSFILGFLLLFAKRGAYTPLLMMYLPLLISYNNKLRNHLKTHLKIYLGLIVLFLIFIFLICPILFKNIITEKIQGENKYNTIGYILTNPFKYLCILFATFFRQFLTLSTQLIGNNLGALNIQNSLLFTIPITLLFIYTLFEKNELEKNKFLIFFSIVIFFISFFGILTALYLGESYNYKLWYVRGVQGRYLIPLLFSIFLICQSQTKVKFENVLTSKNVFLNITMINFYISLFICFWK